MKYDVTNALQALKPGAEWVLRGSEYSGLDWLDGSQTKPTETEVNNKIAALDLSLIHISEPTRPY